MPGYIEHALQLFQHPLPSTHEASPPECEPIQYGAKKQYAAAPDNLPALDAGDTKRIQEVLRTLLYYACAVDSTMLCAIGKLATQQTSGTKKTMEALTQLLNYAASNQDATLRYVVSDMILAIESNASCLSVTKGRSRAAGHFFMTNQRVNDTDQCTANGAVHVLCQIIREILSSAAEAELGALFHNSKEACPLRIPLSEMGHPRNRPPQLLPTTAPPTVSPTTPSNKSAPKRLTCIFTGYTIAYAKASLTYIGAKVATIVPIITPSIIRRNTTRPSDRPTFTALIILPRTILHVLTVMNLPPRRQMLSRQHQLPDPRCL
jgi:hypothetical protein